MNGVTFGASHSFRDWGLVLTEKSIGLPEPWTSYVSVPGRNGDLDLTAALTDEVSYGNRSLTFTFQTTQQISGMGWSELLSTVAAALHGQRLAVILDEDPTWMYLARCSLDSVATSRRLSTLVIGCNAEPLKLGVAGDGVRTLSAAVEGSLTLSLENPGPPTGVTVTTDAAMTLTCDGEAYTLAVGENVLYDLRLQTGTTEITLTGTGGVTIAYRWGCL